MVFFLRKSCISSVAARVTGNSGLVKLKSRMHSRPEFMLFQAHINGYSCRDSLLKVAATFFESKQGCIVFSRSLTCAQFMPLHVDLLPIYFLLPSNAPVIARLLFATMLIILQRAEVRMRVRCANKASAECIMRGRGIGQNSHKNCKKRGICG